MEVENGHRSSSLPSSPSEKGDLTLLRRHRRGNKRNVQGTHRDDITSNQLQIMWTYLIIQGLKASSRQLVKNYGAWTSAQKAAAAVQ